MSVQRTRSPWLNVVIWQVLNSNVMKVREDGNHEEDVHHDLFYSVGCSSVKAFWTWFAAIAFNASGPMLLQL